MLWRLRENGLTINPLSHLEWSPPMDQAFNTTKVALAAVAKLNHPQADFPISLMGYASNTHVRAVLQHFCRSSWALLSFFSKKLTAVETH